MYLCATLGTTMDITTVVISSGRSTLPQCTDRQQRDKRKERAWDGTERVNEECSFESRQEGTSGDQDGNEGSNRESRTPGDCVDEVCHSSGP